MSDELGESAPHCNQLCVGAHLLDAPILHVDHLVCVPGELQLVCHEDYGSAPQVAELLMLEMQFMSAGIGADHNVVIHIRATVQFGVRLTSNGHFQAQGRMNRGEHIAVDIEYMLSAQNIDCMHCVNALYFDLKI